jgi:membrane associated rhomboid family serine protease
VQGSNTGVGHFAHLGGAMTGLLFFLAYKRGLIRPRGYW